MTDICAGNGCSRILSSSSLYHCEDCVADWREKEYCELKSHVYCISCFDAKHIDHRKKSWTEVQNWLKIRNFKKLLVETNCGWESRVENILKSNQRIIDNLDNISDDPSPACQERLGAKMEEIEGRIAWSQSSMWDITEFTVQHENSLKEVESLLSSIRIGSRKPSSQSTPKKSVSWNGDQVASRCSSGIGSQSVQDVDQEKPRSKSPEPLPIAQPAVEIPILVKPSVTDLSDLKWGEIRRIFLDNVSQHRVLFKILDVPYGLTIGLREGLIEPGTPHPIQIERRLKKAENQNCRRSQMRFCVDSIDVSPPLHQEIRIRCEWMY